MPSKSGRLKVLSTIPIYRSIPPPSLCVLQINSTPTLPRNRGISHTLRAQSPKTAPSNTHIHTGCSLCFSSDWPAMDERFPQPPPWISNMSHKFGFPHPPPWWKGCVGQSMREKYRASMWSFHASPGVLLSLNLHVLTNLKPLQRVLWGFYGNFITQA